MRWRTILAGLLTVILLSVSPLTSACALHCDVQTQTQPCHKQSADAPQCAMHTAPRIEISATTACHAHLCDQQATIQIITSQPPAPDPIQPFVSNTITLLIPPSKTHLDPTPASPPHRLTPVTLRTALRV